MRAFTIDAENSITVHSSAKEAEAVPNSDRFSSETALAKLASDWPPTRLVEIWNSLPGETPVRKFKDRATAIGRIWKAIQSLGEVAVTEKPAPDTELPQNAPVPDEEAIQTTQPEATISEPSEPVAATPVAPQTPDVGLEAAPAKNKATRTKKAPAAASTKDAGEPCKGSKTSQVIALLKREGGVTLEEIMTATGWQKHTTRAMLSAGGSLTQNHGLVVTSEKVGDHRKYSLKA